MAEQAQNDHSLFEAGAQGLAPVLEQDFPGIAAFLRRIACSVPVVSESDCPLTDSQIEPRRMLQKRGRKPKPCFCSFCGRTFPYKYALIAHLQGDHDITRSTSVMYKRILQGKRVMKRLLKKVETERAEGQNEAPLS